MIQQTETIPLIPELSVRASYMIKTFGCQANVDDTLRMSLMLEAKGYVPYIEVFDGEEDLLIEAGSADVVILNTCHIREKAAHKLRSELGRWRKIKSHKKSQGIRLFLAVVGCTAQAEGEEIIARSPFVDAVVGPQSLHALNHLLPSAEDFASLPSSSSRQLADRVHLSFDPQGKFAASSTSLSLLNALGTKPTTHGVSTPLKPWRYLTIQEGCDKFCAFCVVPYTRGAEYARPIQDVMEEATQLIKQGVREIILVGQNVNGYADAASGTRFDQLLDALANLEGLGRIRYTSPHPIHMDKALIEAHARIPHLPPWLHLPVQSGSDRILREMNRRHTRRQYLDVIDALRAQDSSFSFTSDFIVGFPGEEDEDFQATLDLVTHVGFIQGYAFAYSPRPGTPASDWHRASDSQNTKTQTTGAMHAPVSDIVAKQRLHKLQALLAHQQTQALECAIDRTCWICVEQNRMASPLVGGLGAWSGRSDHGLTMHTMASDPLEHYGAPGMYACVQPVRRIGFTLQAKILDWSHTLSHDSIRRHHPAPLHLPA